MRGSKAAFAGVHSFEGCLTGCGFAVTLRSAPECPSAHRFAEGYVGSTVRVVLVHPARGTRRARTAARYHAPRFMSRIRTVFVRAARSSGVRRVRRTAGRFGAPGLNPEFEAMRRELAESSVRFDRHMPAVLNAIASSNGTARLL